jgi:hypothetical protein
MKHLLTILAILFTLTIQAQWSYSGNRYWTPNGNTASGDYSTAMGYFTKATGDYSTAMGTQTTASAYFSTALGASTIASGRYSTAMGISSIASDFASTVIGQYNLSGSTATSAINYSELAPAFVIGNGSPNTKSDAFSVLFNGNTTIGGSLTLNSTEITATGTELNYVDGVTSSIQAQLDSKQIAITGAATTIVSNDLTPNMALVSDANGKVAASDITSTELGYLDGVTSSIQTQLDSKISAGLVSVTENSNTGYRLASANASNHGDIGDGGLDLSYQPSASTTTGSTGDYSTAMGYGTTASGENSTAMGYNTTASDYFSTAMGYYTIASGYYSTAMGFQTKANYFYSTAIGSGTTASGNTSTAMGNETTASGDFSTAMGNHTTASAYFSTALGAFTIASGDNSTAMGSNTTASDYSSTVIGQHNSSGSTATSATSFSTLAPAFVIGNGVDASNKSDAFSVLFNGTTTIAGNVTAPAFIGDGSELTNLPNQNTDDQAISYDTTTNIVSLEDGGTIDLGLLNNSGTDDQALNLTGNTLDLEDGGSVNLAGYLDNTDDQAISYDTTTNIVSLEDGGTIDLSLLNNSGTDDQQLANFILSAGSLLSLSIQDGNVVSVNLAPLLADLEAENAQQQAQIDEQQALIDDLIIRMEIREECACDPTLGIGDNTLQPDKAYLLQNIPNPFDRTTSIGYFVPYTNATAHIVISTMAGQIVHNVELSNLGVGAVSIDSGRMAAAMYLYTLYVDGKRIDTKRMIVE